VRNPLHESHIGSLNTMNHLTTIIAGFLLLSGHTAGAAVQNFVIDFENDSNATDIVHGQVIDTEYQNFFGLGSGVSISAINNDDSNADNDAVIFDTNPAADSGNRDADLHAPFNAVNALFPNLPDNFLPGNILILQENNIGCADGVCDVPDDEGTRFSNKPTGVFTFDFDQSVFLETIDFFDVEDAENGTGPHNEITVTLDDQSTRIFHTPETGGNNKYGQVAFNLAGVVKIEVELRGSGGLDNIKGQYGNNIPEPMSIALFGLGLLLLGLMRHRQAVV